MIDLIICVCNIVVILNFCQNPTIYDKWDWSSTSFRIVLELISKFPMLDTLLKSVFSKIRVRTTWVQAVSRQKTGLWLADLPVLTNGRPILLAGNHFNSGPDQRWTRLQILQMALQFCSKNMPNFHKRRFRYFEGFFPHKRVNKWRFFRAFGT